jgi:uncharacterized membrane protein YbaN (DUF454 family)
MARAGREKMKKNIWLIGGSVCLALGVLGIFLPILPTTPFLLLAAFCYGHGSQRFYTWLVDRSWVGSYIRNYRSGLGISLKLKAWTILLLWLTIGSTIGFGTFNWWLKVALLIVAISVTIHLVWLRTLPSETSLQLDDKNLMIHDETNNP